MAGFIYVMSNPSFQKNRLKIGKSDRDPEIYRKAELDTTGVPEPFNVEYWALVDDHHETERCIHKIFSHNRVRSSREFFDIDVVEVIVKIRSGGVIKDKVLFESSAIIELQAELEKLKSELISSKLMLEKELLKIKTDKINQVNLLRAEFASKLKLETNVDGIIQTKLFIGVAVCIFLLPFLVANDKQFFLSGSLVLTAFYLWGRNNKQNKMEELNKQAIDNFPIKEPDIKNISSGMSESLKSKVNSLEKRIDEIIRAIKDNKLSNVPPRENGNYSSSQKLLNIGGLCRQSLNIRATAYICQSCGELHKIKDTSQLKSTKCRSCNNYLSTILGDGRLSVQTDNGSRVFFEGSEIIDNKILSNNNSHYSFPALPIKITSDPGGTDHRGEHLRLRCIHCNTEHIHIYRAKDLYLRCVLCSYEYRPEEIKSKINLI